MVSVVLLGAVGQHEAGTLAAGSLALAGGFLPVLPGPEDDPCPADFNGDTVVNTQDFAAYLNAWAQGDASADMNGDGVVNTEDFVIYLGLWAAGCRRGVQDANATPEHALGGRLFPHPRERGGPRSSFPRGYVKRAQEVRPWFPRKSGEGCPRDRRGSVARRDGARNNGHSGGARLCKLTSRLPQKPGPLERLRPSC